MKWLALLVGAISLLLAGRARTPETVLLIGGDTRGYLSPCGCTKPMTGGMRRRLSVIKSLLGPRTVVLENGGLVASTGRQAELKLETIAEALGRVNAIIALSPEDARLGKAVVAQAQRLSGGRMITASLAEGDHGFASSVTREGLVIASVTPRAVALSQDLEATARPLEEAVRTQLEEAGSRPVVLLLDGNVELARQVAQDHPGLSLIVYSHGGDPPPAEKVGTVTLVSPGERGRHVLRLTWSEGKWGTPRAFTLGPEVADDPDASRSYQRYLKRVADEDLLGSIPKAEGDEYAGSKACYRCHIQPYKVWEKSKHAGALKTLENDGHDKDPECVGCHVVGLDALSGFVSRMKTPDKTDVGCESCHGPSAAHVKDPRVKTPLDSRKACMSCHTSETSPNFDFETYWQRIKH